MFICKNCGRTYPTQTNFCSNCGSNAIEFQNIAPSYYAPAYSAPSYMAQAPSKAPAIFGMILSLIAIILAYFCLGDTISYGGSIELQHLTFSNFVMWSILQTPPNIIGLVLSFKAKTLKGMSITGIVLSFIALALWFIALINALSEL